MIESEKMSLKVSFFARRDPDGPGIFLDGAVGAVKPSQVDIKLTLTIIIDSDYLNQI